MTEFEVTTDGAQLSVDPGDRVVVRLEENPTSGYQWVLTAPSGPLRLEAYDFRPRSLDRPGSGGERVVALRANRPGHSHVRLELRRPWETTAARTFATEVAVASGGAGGSPKPR